eukprot:TRINITY_DN3035_c1_g1_i3.p2 TRINITY_DN3035_c1_g1~~TRINITY_DN3035_c1_g1_i3.p2  ORF type:complete len:222 (-),score=23.09 TRINITY_DN3035_c1_g1_i3:215-835(-)
MSSQSMLVSKSTLQTRFCRSSNPRMRVPYKRAPVFATKPSRIATVKVSNAATFYDFKVKNIDGRTVDLKSYTGKVVLVVNVASQCGFTPQYNGLQDLYQKYRNKGFEILAFPCNQFGAQEPGSNKEIKQFASRKGAKFTIMDKVDVNGRETEPLYDYLKSQKGGWFNRDIKWNFSKFLVDREGKVVDRFGSMTTPEMLDEKIAQLI